MIKEKLKIVYWKKVQNANGKMENNCVRFHQAGGNTQDLCCSSDVGQDGQYVYLCHATKSCSFRKGSKQPTISSCVPKKQLRSSVYDLSI